MAEKADKHLEFFKKLHEVSGDIVIAYESDNDKELENAMGRFIMLMLQADALK
ncbi:hypothetical protein V7152_14905 [Neobacillus drentensis]|uniref:hypothetical protein n=1 Tax=Neobacillus drentensis TaxID=220684 RepID=UPI003000E069